MKTNIEEVQKLIERLPTMTELNEQIRNALDSEGVVHEQAYAEYYLADAYRSIRVHGGLFEPKKWARAMSKVFGLNGPDDRFPFIGNPSSANCKIPDNRWYLKVYTGYSGKERAPAMTLAYHCRDDETGWMELNISRFEVPGYLVVGRKKAPGVVTEEREYTVVTGPKSLSLCEE